MSDMPWLPGFFVIAMVLLVAVTGGVAYLTYVEWQDRRRNGKT
ncbi:MAG: hypothetical protein ACK456_13660 [Pseudanabaenaceae cyanobacterium]|jgi:hypothetical protein